MRAPTFIKTGVIVILLGTSVFLISLPLVETQRARTKGPQEIRKSFMEDKKQVGIQRGYQNEPDGFRDIRWRTNLSQNDDFTLSEPRVGVRIAVTQYFNNMQCGLLGLKAKIYTRKNERLNFGNIKVKSMNYFTCSGILYGVYIEANDYLDFIAIRDALIYRFGPPQKSENADREYSIDARYTESYSWAGSKTNISLSYDTLPVEERLDAIANDDIQENAMMLVFDAKLSQRETDRITREIEKQKELDRQQIEKATKDFTRFPETRRY